MVDPATPPAPVVPPTPAQLELVPTPPATPPGRSAAEIEGELLKTQLALRNLEKDTHKVREENRKKDEQLVAARAGLKAAGLIAGDDAVDAKAILEKQEKDARSKERRETAIERAALKRLIPTGLGEADADLVLGSILRAPGVTFDETTGRVSGIDEAFDALKPTIARLGAKPAGAALPAPPVPPAPSSAAAPPDGEFAAVKTAKDFMTLPASVQERYEAKYPAEAKKFDAEFVRGAQAGRGITFANAPVPAGSPPRR